MAILFKIIFHTEKFCLLGNNAACYVLHARFINPEDGYDVLFQNIGFEWDT
jgi:hypothetical protein